MDIEYKKEQQQMINLIIVTLDALQKQILLLKSKITELENIHLVSKEPAHTVIPPVLKLVTKQKEISNGFQELQNEPK